MKPIETKPMIQDIRKWWLKQVVFFTLTALIMFTLAGTVSWPAAWVYLALIISIIIANALAMDPELMAERSQLQEGTKKWDMLLAVFVAIIGPLCLLAIAALDKRYGWSPGVNLWLQIAAACLFLLGGLLGTWAMAANRYFSGTVRIQEERSHAVVTSGPYRFVRHPGYAGGIVSILMTPILLESWFAFIPAALVAVAYAVRTSLEDAVLKQELTGYLEYSKQVTSRLFPVIW